MESEQDHHHPGRSVCYVRRPQERSATPVTADTHHEAEGPPLTIAMLAPPWIPVPPTGYGGIKQVVELLAAELVSRGLP